MYMLVLLCCEKKSFHKITKTYLMDFGGMETKRREIIALRFFIFREMTLSGRKRSISRGSMFGDGVQTEQVDYNYACVPVDQEDLKSQLRDYIVCVALEKGDTSTKFAAVNIGQCVRLLHCIIIVI